MDDCLGIALFEALVALLILALGVLGLAAVQARMLVETRTTNSRATAIRLIADLGERIRLNAHGAQPAGHSASGLSPYSDSTEDSFPAVVEDAALPAEGCHPAPANGGLTPDRPASCTPVGQAAYDVRTWRQAVAQSLMGGVASIWQVSPRQLRIIVAWSLNENTHTALSGQESSAANSQYRQLAAPLQITRADGVTNLCGDLPDNYICHVDFIGIPPTR